MNEGTSTIESLRRRLAEAEAALEAIRRGEVDLLVGEQPLIVRFKSVEEQKERFRRMLDTVRRVNQWIVRAETREDLLRGALRNLCESGVFNAAWIILTDPSGKPFQAFESGWGMPFEPLAESVRSGTPPPCLKPILESREPLFVESPGPACNGCPLESTYSARGVAIARIDYGESLYGVLALSGPVETMKDQDIRSLSGEIAADLGVALYRLELEAANREVQSALERLATAMDQATEGICVIGKDEKILYVNSAFEDLFHLPAGSLHKGNLGQVVDLPGNEVLGKILREAIRSGKGWSGRFTVRMRKGETKVFGGTVSPVGGYGGEMTGITVILNDVTRMSEMELQVQQAEKMESVGRLTGGVAHDFNNLLSPIIGYAEMALDKLPPAHSIAQDLKEIISSAKRAASLTRQLLAFSRKQVLSPSQLDLNEEIREMLKMLGRLIGEDVHIVTNLRSDLPAIYADAVQIHQILLNLAINARDAMPDGGTLTIETDRFELDQSFVAKHPGARPGDYVLLRFQDTGCGMSREVLDKIFEPFFSTKERGKGTGLGLSTVYGIVKQHGGHIYADSRPGEGAVFSLYFPVFEGEDSDQRSPVETGGDVAHGSEAVLVVEDDPGVRQLVCRILRIHGYAVESSNDPVEAVAIARRREDPLHLLITDVVMPRIDGRELARQISEIHPGVRVLFMSGYTHDIIARRGVLKKGLHLIEKPFTVNELLQKVREVLDKNS
ncbi:MAG: response regulator [Deltaproteobacteria bacterium]|nr:response regulator [Deltaproteobacteria bacterium]